MAKYKTPRMRKIASDRRLKKRLKQSDKLSLMPGDLPFAEDPLNPSKFNLLDENPITGQKFQARSGRPVADPELTFTANNKFQSDFDIPSLETDYGQMVQSLSSEAMIEKPNTNAFGMELSAKDRLQLGGSALASGLAGAEAATPAQAILGGVSAGLSTAALMTGAAAGPVGAVVGIGTALLGLASSKKKKKAAEKARRKREAELKRAEELRLLESFHRRRSNAIDRLAGAFRR